MGWREGQNFLKIADRRSAIEAAFDSVENKTLHDAFIDELRDAYDAEKQLTKALPKLAKAASDPKLRQAFS